MTRHELLDTAKELWMGAALRDQRQFHAGGQDTGTQEDAECAGTLVVASLTGNRWGLLGIWDLTFRCPEHGDGFGVVHFNNVVHGPVLKTPGHAWDWLTLARKLGVAPYDLLEPDREVFEACA